MKLNPRRKKRILYISLCFLSISIAASLVLSALKQNINLFFSPTQIQNSEAPINQKIRIGGMVVEGSVKYAATDLNVQFELTDLDARTLVSYNGILPDLFREGQGIVALGKLNDKKVFIADEVLAKHDETYMPPEVMKAIKDRHNLQTNTVK